MHQATSFIGNSTQGHQAGQHSLQPSLERFRTDRLRYFPCCVGEARLSFAIRREGTAKFMSPEMRILKPGMIGRVDLFWNDVFGLRITIIELTRYLDIGYSTAQRMGKGPPKEFDHAVELAYSIHKAAILTRDQQPSRLTILIEARILFKESFPELEKGAERATSINTPQYNAAFLVRCLGLSSTVRQLLELNKNRSDLDMAVIGYIENMHEKNQLRDGMDSCLFLRQKRQRRHLEETPTVKKGFFQDSSNTMLVSRTNQALQKSDLESLIACLQQLKDNEDLSYKRKLYSWLIAVVSEKWNGETGHPPDYWSKSQALYVEAAALHYWAGNLSQATTLLIRLAQFFGLRLRNQKSSFVEMISSLLQSGDMEQNCYEVLFLMLMDNFSKHRKWKEMLSQTDYLLEKNNVPRMVLAAVHYHKGISLQMLKSIQQSLSALSTSLALLMKQPRTSQIQVTVVKQAIANNRFELGQVDAAVALLNPCITVYRRSGSAFDEHLFQSLAVVATCYIRVHNNIKARELIDQISDIFSQERSEWVMEISNTYCYVNLLYQKFLFEGCMNSVSTAIQLTEGKLSQKYIEDIFSAPLQEIVRSILLVCVVCRSSMREESLVPILDNTTRSLLRRLHKMKVVGEYSLNGMDNWDTLLRTLEAREDLLPEFFGLSATLVFRFLLLKDPKMKHTFRSICSVLKARNNIFLLYCEYFSVPITQLAYLFRQQQNLEGIQLLLELPLPRQQEHQLILGQCLRATGNHKRSIQVLQDLLATLPIESTSIMKQWKSCAESDIAHSMMKMGKHEESKVHYRRAIAINSQIAKEFHEYELVKANNAKWLYEMGEYEQAMTWLRKIPSLWRCKQTEVVPMNLQVYCVMAGCFFGLRKYREGLWAIARAHIAKQKGASTPDRIRMEYFSNLHKCKCLCELKRFHALRRHYSQLYEKDIHNRGLMIDMQAYLNQHSNVLAYAIPGREPSQGTNLHKFLKGETSKLENSRNAKRILLETVTIKKILRLLVADSSTRRTVLTGKKRSLLRELQNG